MPGDQAVTLGLAQRLGQHLVCDPFDAVVEVLVAATAVGKLPEDSEGPAATEKMRERAGLAPPIKLRRFQDRSSSHLHVASSSPLGYGISGLHRHSRPIVRAPRMVMTASPAKKTSAAHSALPRSLGGRAGHVHGVCQPELSASSAKAR